MATCRTRCSLETSVLYKPSPAGVRCLQSRWFSRCSTSDLLPLRLVLTPAASRCSIRLAPGFEEFEVSFVVSISRCLPDTGSVRASDIRGRRRTGPARAAAVRSTVAVKMLQPLLLLLLILRLRFDLHSPRLLRYRSQAVALLFRL